MTTRPRDPKFNHETGDLIEVPASYVNTPPKPRRDAPAPPTPGPRKGDGARGARQAGQSPLEEPTRPIEDSPKPEKRSRNWSSHSSWSEGEERTGDGDRRTRLIPPGRDTEETPTPGPPEAADPMADPVTGWLVVTAGPGKGRVCRLGIGVNSLGRGGGSRVRIDFGDDSISREGHAVLTYDPRGRKYYLQHGGGMNLTYLGGDKPVLTPTLLAPMQDISIGATTLRFVPLCGPDFDWQDLEDAGGA